MAWVCPFLLSCGVSLSIWAWSKPSLGSILARKTLISEQSYNSGKHGPGCQNHD